MFLYKTIYINMIIKNNIYMIKLKPKVLIADVDGVMTNCQLIYSKSGKIQKFFGLDDHNMLSILKNYLEIRFITGDKKGFKISKRRIVDDMSFKLDLVSTIKRLDWIQKKYDFNNKWQMQNYVKLFYDQFFLFNLDLRNLRI
jgi:hypothetical protein